MDLDLSRALHDAAQSGTAHRPALDAAPVIGRIHRRRAVRHAVEGTVGVAAAGAVAVGAAQGWDLRGFAPAPPVAPAPASPTPLPTTSSDSAPAAWPAVTAVGDLGCGLPFPDVVDPAGEADLRLEPWLSLADDADDAEGTGPGAAPVELPAGGSLTVAALLVNGTDRELDAAAAGPVTVWLVAAGSVVGTLDWESSAVDGRYTLLPGAGLAAERPAGAAVACDPDGSRGGPLPAGDYDVLVVQDLRLGGGETVRVTGAPATVRITASTVDPVDPSTPVEPVDGHPDLGELVLSPAGLGPLAVGVPPASNPGAAMIELDPTRCEGAVGGSPARWVASGYPQETVDGQPRDAFFVAASDEAVGRIDVLGRTIRTAEGVGVGTTLAELQATYPALEGPFDGSVSRVWWLSGPTGTLVFETQGDADGLQPAGTPESVILLRVLAAGVDPAFATANSGDLAGACG